MTGSSVNVETLSSVMHVSATPAFGGKGQIHNAPDVTCDANATQLNTRCHKTEALNINERGSRVVPWLATSVESQPNPTWRR